jgi:hypothetical protein
VIGEEKKGDEDENNYGNENSKENIGDSMNISTGAQFNGRPLTSGKQ